MRIDEIDEPGQRLRPFTLGGPAVKLNLEPVNRFAADATAKLKADAAKLEAPEKRLRDGGALTSSEAGKIAKSIPPITGKVAAARPDSEKQTTARLHAGGKTPLGHAGKIPSLTNRPGIKITKPSLADGENKFRQSWNREKRAAMKGAPKGSGA